MKTPLLLPALLVAAFSVSLSAAPGTVLTVVEHIDQGDPNIPSLDDSGLFGRATASLGDLDGNGHEELAVGQPGNRAVHILFRGSGGLVTSSLTLRPAEGGLPPSVAPVGSRFGQALANLGDLDGDGLPEVAVGAPGEDAVYVLFLNADGSVRQHVRIPSESGDMGTDFGASLAAVGDLDGNGVSDLIAGAPLDDSGAAADSGAVHTLFLNSDGTAAAAPIKIANGLGGVTNGDLLAGDQFGSSCALIGDIDLDGFPEIAVGARFDDTGGANRGALHTFSLDANGTVSIFQKFAHGTGTLTLGNGDLFGSSVTSLGDIDGNGVPDLAVGATDEGPGNLGAVHILFLAPDGSLAATSKIADGIGGLPFATLGDQNENFGFSLALLGSSSVNQLPLLAVGTPGDEGGGNDKGAVYLLELGNPPILVTTLEDEIDFMNSNRSLREAIFEADNVNAFVTIRFDPSLSGGTLFLNTDTLGTITIPQEMRITGEDLADGLTIAGQGLTRMFEIPPFVAAKIDSLDVRDAITESVNGGGAFLVSSNSRLVLECITFGGCSSNDAPGGAIATDGSIAISNCTFTGNTAPGGGAVHLRSATASMTVLNTTFDGNRATDAASGGGAILCATSSFARFRHCTFAGNEATNVGGAIRVDGATAIRDSSLFSGNVAGSGGDDVSGSIFFVVGNGTDSAFLPITELMPLADYGGPTQTRPLKPTSTAKGTVSYRALPATDQRGLGFSRTVGTGRDPGAVEGTEPSDFQPDNRIGLSLGRQIGNNRYNTNGAGQTIALKLSGKRKAKTFFTVDNDGLYLDSIRVKSDAPSRRSLNGKVFSLTGGRRNVSAQVFRTGLALTDLAPGGSVAFQGEWSRKSLKVKPKQTAKLTSSSTTAPKSDVAGTKVSGR